MKAPLLRRHAATLGFAALMLVLAAVVAAATAYHLVHLRSVELQRLGDAAAHHARVFESHLSHSLNVVDLTLGNLADGDVPGSDPAARSAHLRLALRHAPYLRSLSILDPDGRVVASSEPANLGLQPALGRLQPETSPEAVLLRFGRPWEGRDMAGGRATTPDTPVGSGTPNFVPVVRALDARRRVVAALNPDYFIGQMANALPIGGGGAAEVLSLDGVVWLSSDESARAPAAGARMRVPGLDLGAPGQAAEGLLEWARSGEQVELVAFRLSRVYPLAVQVRMDRAVAQQAWQRQARGLLGAVVLLFLIALGIAVAVFRHVRRLEREWQDAEMRARDRLAGVVFESSAEAILVTDGQNRVLRVNPAYTRLTGYTEDEVRGRNPRLSASGRHDEAFYAAMWRDILTRGLWKGELTNRRKDGSLYPVSLTVSVVRDERGQVVNHVGLFVDISERVAREDHIRYLSEHDVLTGLPNRALFADRVRQAIMQGRRSQRFAAVLFIDLDRFKAVNDVYGHPVGDQLLQETARRLQAALRESDTVGRQGGDEFLVLLPDLAERGDAERVLDKLMTALCEPYRLGALELHVTPSIGASVFPDDGEDFETLVRAADTAMYHSKSNGRGASHFFSAEMSQAADERLTLEAALRHALDRHELRLHYQPLVDLADGRVTGFEALLRWREPARGEVPPATFIPVAEDSGMIVPIGAWVLREACRQLRQWRDDGLHGLSVAVNVSARQLAQANFEAMVFAALAEHGLEGNALELEVTESVLLADQDHRVEQLRRLRDAGVRLSIDDFGTGYSSLSYLRRLPIDRIKIDRSFIREVTDNTGDALIVGALIDMAHGIGLRVLGEGVETDGQHGFLRDHGCDAVQGYLFARPMPADEVAPWLGARQTARALPAETLAAQMPAAD